MREKGAQAWLFTFLKGILIGGGAILPGVSGGVLCVAMGVYRPVMALLAHPLTQIRENGRALFPIVAGVGAGFVLFSLLLAGLFARFETEATWLFLGLILGSVPALFVEAGREGRPRSAFLVFAVVFAGALALFWGLRGAGGARVQPNFFWWLLSGALWGVGMIVPGLSPSAVFLYLGLYQPMFEGVARLDFSVLLPMGAGLALTVFALARGVEKLFAARYAQAMHAVLAFLVASSLSVLPFGRAGTFLDGALYAACFLLGLLCALCLNRAPGEGSPAQ